MQSKNWKRLLAWLLTAAAVILILARYFAQGSHPRTPVFFQPGPVREELRIGAIVLLSVGVLATPVIVYVMAIWQQQFNRRMANTYDTDFPALNSLRPEQAIPTTAAALSELGFSYIEPMPIFAADKQEPEPGWAYMSQDNQVAALIYAPTGATRIPLLLATCYTDGALLETRYPGGARIRRPDYRALVCKESHQEAVALHLRHREEFNARHGSPIRFTSIKDFKTWYTTFWLPRHKLHYDRQAFIQGARFLAALWLVAFLSLAGLIALPRSANSMLFLLVVIGFNVSIFLLGYNYLLLRARFKRR